MTQRDAGNSLLLTTLVNDRFCNLNKDYDLTNYDDWDLLDECCDDAAANKILDSDCTNMPPRPTENTNGGGSDGPSEAEDGVVQECNPSLYDFTNPAHREVWTDCCRAVAEMAKRDPACEVKRW